MVERDRGTERQAREAETQAPGYGAALSPGIDAPAEEADRARFLKALDEVMDDHHNVLAALAK